MKTVEAAVIGVGWNFPPSYPNHCSTWIEIAGVDGALVLNDTQRETISGIAELKQKNRAGLNN